MDVLLQKRPQQGLPHRKLENYLYSEITRGVLRPGDKLSTEKLAEEWNISKGTVNKSLATLASKGLLVRKTRAGTFVSEDAPDNLLHGISSNVVALLAPDMRYAEYAYLAQGLQDTLDKNTPCVLGAYGLGDDQERQSELIRRQIRTSCHAIVLVPPLSGRIPTDILIELYRSKIPVVTCFRRLDNFGWPSVAFDVTYNTETAIKHLHEIGCKKIGAIALDGPDSHLYLSKEHVFTQTLGGLGLTSERSMCTSLSMKFDTLAQDKM